MEIPTKILSTLERLDPDLAAQAVRQSIVKARIPHFVQNYMSVASVLMESAANQNRAMFFGGEPHTLSVNSTFR
jgi:hypothetical protein